MFYSPSAIYLIPSLPIEVKVKSRPNFLGIESPLSNSPSFLAPQSYIYIHSKSNRKNYAF